jgi:hypothetical protein
VEVSAGFSRERLRVLDWGYAAYENFEQAKFAEFLF